MVKEIVGVFVLDFGVDGIDDFVVVEVDYLNDWVYVVFFFIDELCMVEKSCLCQVMVREIVGVFFLEVNIFDIGEVEGFNDQNNNISEFILIEDNIMMKLMEGYICMFSKYIIDVSGVRNFDNVDYRFFIIEFDSFMVYFDDVFRYYLDNFNRKFIMKLDFDFNLFFCGLGGLNLFFFCVILMELFYRYG